MNTPTDKNKPTETAEELLKRYRAEFDAYMKDKSNPTAYVYGIKVLAYITSIPIGALFLLLISHSVYAVAGLTFWKALVLSAFIYTVPTKAGLFRKVLNALVSLSLLLLIAHWLGLVALPLIH